MPYVGRPAGCASVGADKGTPAHSRGLGGELNREDKIMTNENLDMDKRPTPDPAENNAFFPSRYSLDQYTSPKSDLSGGRLS
jgi:hypothetical protein